MESQKLFSFPRFMMVARFYYPRLKKQIIILPIVAFVIGLLSVTAIVNGTKGLFVIASLILGACYIFSPLIFATRKGIEIETMLPATWVEKSVFIIGYCIIGVSILYFVPIILAELSAHLFLDYSCQDLTQMLITQGFMYETGYNLINTVFFLALCMTAVMCSTRDRIIRGILWVIAGEILFFVIGAVEGILVATHTEWSSPEEVENSVSVITAEMAPVFTGLTILMIAAIAGMIAMTTYKIKNRQI